MISPHRINYSLMIVMLTANRLTASLFRLADD